MAITPTVCANHTHTHTYKYIYIYIILHYSNRGYPLTLLQEKLAHVLQKDRHSLLHPPAPPTQPVQAEQNLFCVVTYHPCNPPILDIIKSNWKILECTPTLKCISDKEPKIGFKRNPNLRNLLVHSKVSYPPIPTRTTGGPPKPGKICSKTNCPYCSTLDKGGACRSFVTSQKYIVPSKISCKLNNLVYLFSCTRCGLQYVGETYRTLAERLSEHLRDIRHEANPDSAPPSVIQKGPSTVARHFGRAPHSQADLKVQILELI